MVGGLNITEQVAEIEEQGYTIVPDFISAEEIARIRHAFDTEVRITEMRAIGTKTGQTWRAHNLLAKTRAVDYLFLDPRIRALVEGVLGNRTQVNVTTLFNVLPGETASICTRTMGCGPSLARIRISFATRSSLWMIKTWKTAPRTSSPSATSGTIGAWTKAWKHCKWKCAPAPCSCGRAAWWHGGGANKSKDRERLGFFMSHNVAYLRPQEIQLVSVPREVARELPEELLRLLGYHRFGLGVDGRDPVDVLHDGDVVNPHAQLAAEWRSQAAR